MKYQLKNRWICISNLKYGERVTVVAEGREDDILMLKNGKLLDRIVLDNVEVLGRKYVNIDKNGKK